MCDQKPAPVPNIRKVAPIPPTDAAGPPNAGAGSVPGSDGFAAARESLGVLPTEFAGESIPMILRYKDVRAALQNPRTFSNNAPFRVPIPSEEALRRVRQLPIETDPPEHTEYRAIVDPFFRQAREAFFATKIDTLIAELLADACGRESIEIVREFALPLQSRALTFLLKVPESEAAEWIGWGTHVFHDSDGTNSGGRLDAYIQRRLDEAREGVGDDIFSTLNRATYQGRPLTRDEMVGFINLTFAGGRDTIIQTVASAMGYLAENPTAFDQLRRNPQMIHTAAEEFFRVVSPLTHIGRVCPHGADVHGVTVEPDHRVSVCFASANYDPEVFGDPDELKLDRKPNPHLAFGAGVHNCIGAAHSRVITRSLLRQMIDRVVDIRVISAKPNMEIQRDYQRRAGYESLVMTLTAKA